MKILMVLTSHGTLGNTDRAAGFWLEELAAPYYTFKDAGLQVAMASPKGGRPPLNPIGGEPAFQTDVTRRFQSDLEAVRQLSETLRLSTVSHEDFDAAFYPGGLGPLWDLAEDPDSIALIQSLVASHKCVALVCHAPGALRHVMAPDGTPLVKGRKVTGFTNSEENTVELAHIVPFLVEDELKAKGAIFSRGADWAPHVVVDFPLITGQNPASSTPTAVALLRLLAAR